MAGHAELNIPPVAVSEHTANLATADEAPFGDKEWTALIRMLDRKDSSFRN
jgi:hypothetical protein